MGRESPAERVDFGYVAGFLAEAVLLVGKVDDERALVEQLRVLADRPGGIRLRTASPVIF